MHYCISFLSLTNKPFCVSFSLAVKKSCSKIPFFFLYFYFSKFLSFSIPYNGLYPTVIFPSTTLPPGHAPPVTRHYYGRSDGLLATPCTASYFPFPYLSSSHSHFISISLPHFFLPPQKTIFISRLPSMYHH